MRMLIDRGPCDTRLRLEKFGLVSCDAQALLWLVQLHLEIAAPIMPCTCTMYFPGLLPRSTTYSAINKGACCFHNRPCNFMLYMIWFSGLLHTLSRASVK